MVIGDYLLASAFCKSGERGGRCLRGDAEIDEARLHRRLGQRHRAATSILLMLSSSVFPDTKSHRPAGPIDT